jgi:hypothetical protein
MLRPPLPMTMTFLTSTRFFPYSITPLSRYASLRGASSTNAHRRAERVNFLACCHDGVRGARRCCLVAVAVLRLEKERRAGLATGRESRSKMLLAWRSARVVDAIAVGQKCRLASARRLLSQAAQAGEAVSRRLSLSLEAQVKSWSYKQYDRAK